MLIVVEVMLFGVIIGMSNLNYMFLKVEVFLIESVFCLIEVKNGEMVKKFYVFYFIEYVFEEFW